MRYSQEVTVITCPYTKTLAKIVSDLEENPGDSSGVFF